MVEYRRNFKPGGRYFFTQVAYERRAWLCTQWARRTLRNAIEKQRIVRNAGAAPSEQEGLVRSRIVRFPGRQHQERAVKSAGELALVVPVRVVDERSRPGGRDIRDERFSRLDRRRPVLCGAIPSRDTIVIAVDLDSVPVNGRRVVQLVDDLDFNWLPPRKDDWRADYQKQIVFLFGVSGDDDPLRSNELDLDCPNTRHVDRRLYNHHVTGL